MNKKELLEFNNALKSVSDLKGVKFAYAVTKNKNNIKNEVEAIVEAQNQSDEYKEYEKERIALCEEMAIKDENGKPKINKFNYEIEDEKAFEVKFDELKEKHKEAIEKREKQLEDFELLLEEAAEVKIHKVKIEDLPNDITPKQLEGIFEMLMD